MHKIQHHFDIACITGIQSKKIKIGKSQELFVYDLKIKVECKQAFLQSLSYGSPPEYDNFFFENDGTLKPHCISTLTISTDINEHQLLVDLDLAKPETTQLLNVKFSDFKIVPVLGFEYVVNFVVRTPLDDDELLFLNKAAKQKEVVLTVKPPIEVSPF